MAVSKPKILQELALNALSLGDKAVVSDSYMEIEGFESLSVLVKQFPWPTITPQGEIEVSTPLGGGYWQAQQLKTHQQGAISFAETVDGKIAKLFQEINNAGGYFNATIYEGLPSAYTRKAKISHCFVQVDNPDRDQESRAQILLYSGTIFFLYYGDEE